MTSRLTRSSADNPTYNESCRALMRVLEESGHHVDEIRLIAADPAEVPAGEPIWTATFQTWAWLKIRGAPMGPRYHAAEVVIGDGWCAANSCWNADDWVLAPCPSSLLARVREADTDILDLLIPNDPEPAIEETAPAVEITVGPAAGTDEDQDDESFTVAELGRRRTYGPAPWMLSAYRTRLARRFRRSRFGEIIEYPTEVVPKCRNCRSGRASLACIKCQSTGKIGRHKDTCHYCDGYGEHYVCLNPYCSAYHEAWAKDFAVQDLNRYAIEVAERKVEVLSRAEAERATVRFQYRPPNGRESTWEVRPLGWDLKEQTGREIHGVRPGNLFIYVAFDVPIYKTKRFALDAITKIEILGSVPARGKIERLGPLDDFAIGDLVLHQVFGSGRIRSLEGTNEKPRAIVHFTKHGTKTLDLNLVRLSRIAAN